MLKTTRSCFKTGTGPLPVLKQRRNGFTLVELMVVIAIIAVLAILTIGASIQFMESQRESNTQTVLSALDKALQSHVKAVLDQADKESIPANVLSMAGSDPKRARVIWKCLRLKQEFPINFSEVKAPWLNYDGSANTYIAQSDLPPSSTYVTALGGSYNQSTGVVTGVPADNIASSSACLLMALQRNRKGAASIQDSIAANVVDVNSNGIKVIVDGWGRSSSVQSQWRPVYFFRFPSGNADLDSTSPAGPAPVAGVRASTFRNPLDPDGLLLDTSWTGAIEFGKICFTPQPAKYMIPVIVSAGQNGRLGLNVGPPADMSVSNANDANDNIYSYRLRVGATGN